VREIHRKLLEGKIMKFDDSRLVPAQTSAKQIVLGLQVQY